MGEIFRIQLIRWRSMGREVDGWRIPPPPPTRAAANFTITNQGPNWDFIRHLTLIEPFELTWGKWKWIHFASDVCKYELGCVVCVLAIGGEGQQVVASGCRLKPLISASPRRKPGSHKEQTVNKRFPRSSPIQQSHVNWSVHNSSSRMT